MIGLFLTVLDEGDKRRRWHICRDKNNQPNVAYSESSDGLNRIKPNLGISEYDGNKDNNLVRVFWFGLSFATRRCGGAPAPN